MPRSFTADTLPATFPRDKFPRLSNEEINRLRPFVRLLDVQRSVWQLTVRHITSPSFETGDGLLSRLIPWNLQTVMKSEITRRPIDEPVEVCA